MTPDDAALLLSAEQPYPDAMPPIKPHPEGTEVLLWVVPGASRSEIVGIHDGALRLRISAPPEGGKANRAVVVLLASATGARVRLLSGTTSRRKRALLVGMSEAHARKALGVE